jgi:cell division protein FtsB
VRAVALRRARLSLGIGPQIVIVALVLGLAGAMAIQPTRQLLAQRDRIAQMNQDLSRMRADNERLAAYLERLRDPNYLEQQAREQLGLVRPGETSYVVMPPSRRQSALRDRRAETGPRRGAPGAATFLERLLRFIGVS